MKRKRKANWWGDRRRIRNGNGKGDWGPKGDLDALRATSKVLEIKPLKKGDRKNA